ncbi:MAG: glycerol kinase GlpK [Clostridia bacterium]|nr:glycerol kinase GlpK [Clostridia bacterium]
MAAYIMAMDQGTTSSRCVIYDREGNQISVAQKEFTQYYPEQGWVEHDASEIWETQMTVAYEAMLKAGASYRDIAALGITNQRETTIVWDRHTGEPVCRAIVWQCRRTADYCEELLAKDPELSDRIREKTGLLLDPYFSGTKLHWILENVPGAREKAEAGDLLFGTVETWLIWKMTGGRVHITDVSNASRTMMYNIHTLEWDQEILELLDIPAGMLPEVRPSSQIYGETEPELFGGSITISGAAGDQQAALFGQACFDKGSAKSTYGTGNFLLMNTGDEPILSKAGLVTTIGWQLGDEVTYALEGSAFVCGALIQWLRDELGIIRSSGETEAMAIEAGTANGVYIVPAFTGLGAPYWDPHARGTIFGLTRGANRNHIARAALEAMAYQCADLITAMTADTGVELQELQVDGGACANNFLMQFQADILKSRVCRPAMIETTSLGAAYLAGLAVGYWADTDEISANRNIDRVFRPEMSDADVARHIEGWKDAVRRTLSGR